MRDVNGALKDGGRGQWKFKLQFLSDRGFAMGLYQHAFVGQVEDLARRYVRSLDEPACALNREPEKSPFLIHSPLRCSDYNKYMRSICEKPFSVLDSLPGQVDRSLECQK